MAPLILTNSEKIHEIANAPAGHETKYPQDFVIEIGI
jgi:hypothetical protein